MLEARVKQLKNQACENFRYNESLKARLVPFLRKEAAEKEDDDEEEDQQAWPSGSSDDDGPVSPIRFLRVSTRMVYSSTSKASSRMQCHRPMWSNNISIFLGCSICNHE
jgi:hypothetical protein